MKGSSSFLNVSKEGKVDSVRDKGMIGNGVGKSGCRREKHFSDVTSKS
jgi:hypothetical protein